VLTSFVAIAMEGNKEEDRNARCSKLPFSDSIGRRGKPECQCGRQGSERIPFFIVCMDWIELARVGNFH
jgi:hypothetical protein